MESTTYEIRNSVVPMNDHSVTLPMFTITNAEVGVNPLHVPGANQYTLTGSVIQSRIEPTYPITVVKMHPGAILPSYGHEHDGCFDLSAACVVEYEPNTRRITYDTGLGFDIPIGKVMLVMSRSGHGFKHEIRLGNIIGVIDSGYQDSVKVKLKCDNPYMSIEDMTKAAGTKIAQAIIIDRPKMSFNWGNFEDKSSRGTNGFGSTGV